MYYITTYFHQYFNFHETMKHTIMHVAVLHNSKKIIILRVA